MRRSSRWLLSIASLLVALGITATAAAQVVVDDFADAQGPVGDPGTVASTADQAVGTILGGERDLRVQRVQGSGIAAAEVLSGLLRVDAPSPDTGAELVAVWDGNDDDATALDPTGLGGVDLTTGNAGGLAVVVDSAGAAFAVVLTVYTDGANSSRAARRVEAPASPTTVVLDLSELEVHTGSGADLGSVGAVELAVSVIGATVDISSVAMTAPTVTVAKQALDSGGVPVAGPLTPGASFTYRVQVDGEGGETSAGRVTDDIADELTLVPGSVLTTPVARPDQYCGLGNVPTIVAAPGLLGNDSDPDDGGPLAAVVATAQATAAGGLVDIGSDGSFVYTPPAGLRGVDQFSYTVVDDEGQQATGFATVALSQMVWFVDSDACALGALPCGSGTFGDPFGEIEQAQAAALPADVIRLRQGANDLSHHDQGIVLQPGQRLIGAGVDLVLDGVVVEGVDSDPDLDPTPANRPSITHTSGQALALADGVTVLGLDIESSSMAGVFGDGVDGATLDHVAVVDSGGPALELVDSTNLDLRFTGLDSAGSTGHGLHLDTVAGAVTVAGPTQLDDPAQSGVRIESSPGLVATFGDVTVTAAGGPTSHAAVHLAGNPGAMLTFGALALASENGDGLYALDGGSVSHPLTGSTITAAGGAALDLESTTGLAGGASGWRFDALDSSASPDHGVRLVSLSDPLAVATSTTITDADTTGLLVQGSPGLSFELGATSVTDTTVGAGATQNGLDLATGTAGASFSFASLVVVTDGGFGLRTGDPVVVNVAATTGNQVVATGGVALDLSQTTLGGAGLILDALSSTGSPGRGVSLVSTTGILTAAAGTITGSAATAFHVGGGAPVVSYGGDVTQSSAQRVVDIEGTTGGAVAFASGTVTGGAASLGVRIHDADGNASFADLDLGTAGTPMTNQAITLTGGSTGTFGFADTQVYTAGATGLYASAGGVVEVTGAGNRVSAVNGRAVSLEGGTAVGPDGVTFERLDSSGADHGLLLADTGTAGVFTVTGDGSLSRNDSGGVILGPTDHGVKLSNAHGVVLRSVRIDGIATAGRHGIASSGGSGVVLSAVTVQNVTGGLDVVRSSGWRAAELGGVNRIDHDSLFTGFGAVADGAVDVRNQTVNMTSLTLDASTFSGQHENNGKSMVFVEGAGTADMGTVTVHNGCSFTGLRGMALQTGTNGAASMTTVISGNTFRDANPGGLGGINGVAVTASGSSSHTATLTGNDLDDVQLAAGNASSLAVTAFGTSSLVATVDGNRFLDLDGDGGVVADARGIGVVSEQTGGGAVDVTVSNNVLDGIGRQAIFVSARAQAPDVDVRIVGNTIGATTPVGFTNRDAIAVSAEDDANLDVLITGNAVTGTASSQEVLDLFTDRVDLGNTPVLNATVGGAGGLANTFTNVNGAGADNVVVETVDSGESLCLDMPGNTLVGVTTIDLFFATGATFGVTQSDAAALAAANGGATVNAEPGVSFDQGPCPQPTF